jgi:hypothetical protein
MIILYDENEFKNSNAEAKFNVQCEICLTVFQKKKREINKVLRGIRPGKYCSEKCETIGKNKQIIVNCLNCNTEFKKKRAEIKKSPNNFCSRSCAVTYNNKHKTKGTRVSKLEKWLQEHLTIQYPDLEIHYNRKDAINSELDIYIPSLKLAFELNGIFHYEPIYGAEKLQQIQNNDDRKFQACLEKGISLCIIDTSGLKYWKPEKGKLFLNIIKNTIKLHS